MSLARVDDENREPAWKLDPAPLERAAVEKERLPCAPEERSSLVEDARRHADAPLLRTPTDLGELDLP